MYGQLLLAHSEADTIYPESGAVTYKNKTWTADNSKLMAFYYLGVASNMIPIFAFNPKAGKLTTFNFFIKPTLSPNDPTYTE